MPVIRVLPKGNRHTSTVSMQSAQLKRIGSHRKTMSTGTDGLEGQRKSRINYERLTSKAQKQLAL